MSSRDDDGHGYGSTTEETSGIETATLETTKPAAALKRGAESCSSTIETVSVLTDAVCADERVGIPPPRDRSRTRRLPSNTAGNPPAIEGVGDGEEHPSTNTDRSGQGSDGDRNATTLPGAWQMPGIFRSGDRNSSNVEPASSSSLNVQDEDAAIITVAPLPACVAPGEDDDERRQNHGAQRRRHTSSSFVTNETYDGVAVVDDRERREKGPCGIGWAFRSWPLAGICALVVAAVVAVAVAVPLSLQTRAARQTEHNLREDGGSSSSDSADRPPSPSDAALANQTNSTSASGSSGLSPESERFVSIKAVLQALLALKGLSPSALDDDASPQGRALRWIADEDDRQLDWVVDDPNLLVQRFAAATIYFATGGGEGFWSEDCNFLSDEHVCEWHCTENVTDPDADVVDDSVMKPHLVPGHNYSYIGIRCFGDNKSIDGIILKDNNLTGVLPEEIGALSNLKYLEISVNPGLIGPIPKSLGSQLPALQSLILHSNNISSTLPTSLGDLKQLRDLHVGYNRLVGTIPRELNNLRMLENLLLSKRFVDPSLPFLETNSFSGLMPFDEAEGSLVNLRVLEIGGSASSGGGLNGTIPPTLCTFRNLTALNLRNNALTGSLPSCLGGSLTLLREIVVPNNMLTGTIPPSIFTNLEQLEVLTLAMNDLSGSIPGGEVGLSKLSNLEFLHLASNDLTGELPPNFGVGLGRLRGLYLYDNDFSGSLPISFGDMIELRGLTLFLNKFSWTLPDSMGSLTKLMSLSLHNNQFSGQVPKSMDRIESLKWINLSNNSFTGDVTSLCQEGIAAGAGAAPWMSADCHRTRGKDNNDTDTGPEVRCDCCAFCCSDDEEGPLTLDDLFYDSYKSIGITGLDHGCYLV